MAKQIKALNRYNWTLSITEQKLTFIFQSVEYFSILSSAAVISNRRPTCPVIYNQTCPTSGALIPTPLLSRMAGDGVLINGKWTTVKAMDNGDWTMDNLFTASLLEV